MHRLVLLGLNHHTAPLAVREKLALAADECRIALRQFSDQFTGSEAVLLSTCNRAELYVARPSEDSPPLSELTSFLLKLGRGGGQDLSSHLYTKVDRSAAEHLFNVASSLDSMVLGETQILGQVREAYDLARAAGTAGALLNPLLQRAIATGKQVLAQTALAEGRVSIASVAVECARRIFDTFTDKHVLVVGAGKMAGLLCTHLAALAPAGLIICNRDPDKAIALASRCGGTAGQLQALIDHLAVADIVVCSTGSPDPIISRKLFETVMRRRRNRPVFLIDIALPRDIEPAVGDLANVYLYNLDDLQHVVAATQQQRQGAVDAARQIVAEHVTQFAQSLAVRDLGPTIHRLYRQYHRIAQDELARTISKMGPVSDADQRHLQDLARRIVNKLLHQPIQRLRESETMRASTALNMDALQSLFDLEPSPLAGQSELPTELTDGTDP